MKKLLVVSMSLCLLVSSGFAIQSGTLPYGVGAKYAAMGGAGSALVNDITSAYFNPAGIVKALDLELKLGGGTATEGANDLLNTLSNISSPAKFMADNYAKTVNIKGGLNAFVGFNLAKVGLSVIPIANLTISKSTANSIAGTLTGSVNYEGILTIGNSFSIPGLPIASLDTGVNIKSVNTISSTSSNTGTTSSTDNVISYTGLGYDVGVKANFDTLIMPISLAIVMKDLSETLKGKNTAITSTYDLTGKLTNEAKVETNLTDMTNPTTLVIGAAAKIPFTGLTVAADIDSVSGSGTSYSVTHLGVEYPVMMGFLNLRAGSISGGPSTASISQTTVGVGINLGLGVNVATVTDNNNAKNNQTIVDCGFAF